VFCGKKEKTVVVLLVKAKVLESLHLILPVLLASIGTVAGVAVCIVKVVGYAPCSYLATLLCHSEDLTIVKRICPNQLHPHLRPECLGYIARSLDATSRPFRSSSAAIDITRS
jgi:hypothetical protein